MVIDFALPIDGDLAAGFERYKRVSKRSVMDYSFHMAVTTWNEKVRALLIAHNIGIAPPISSILMVIYVSANACGTAG